MERRVQCLERIVREQQQEMERLMGIVLTRSPPLLESSNHLSLRSAGIASAVTTPGYVIEVPNQNFYFHDEITQANLAADVVGRQAKAKQRKSPLLKEQAWEMQIRGAGFVEKPNKAKAFEGAHAFMRALPVQPTTITKTANTPKTAITNRVPMKQSRAVNAAKDFIDYIANKQNLIIAKAATEAALSKGPSYGNSSRTIPQSKSSTAPAATARRKKILAPTIEINAKKTSLTPEKNIDLRNRPNRPASNMASHSGRTTFISNADRDNLASYPRRTTFVSNSDRNTLADNSDRNSFNYDGDYFESSVDRGTFDGNPHRNTFGNYPDQNSYMSYSDRGAYNNNRERNMYVGNSDRNLYANDSNRNDYSNNSAANTYAANEDRNMFAGNMNRNSFSNGGDRNVYAGPPYRSAVAHNADRNTSILDTDRSSIHVHAIHSTDRNISTQNTDRSRMHMDSTLNTDRNVSAQNRDPSTTSSVSVQQVVTLSSASIGTKRKEKEKMEEESEVRRKKPAAVRDTVIAIPVPSSSSSTSSESSSRSSSQSSNSSRSSRTSVAAPVTYPSSYPSTPSNPLPSARSTSSQSNTSHKTATAPAPSATYPSYSAKYPAAYPSSSSSSSYKTNKAVVTSPGRRESNFHDMTGDESEDESENDQERQKINKVLSLIQTLSSLPDRQQMAEQLLDKYKTKPAKTKKLINAGKEIFQEWLVEEVLNFSEDTNVKLVELMLNVTDKATWTPADISRLRVDRTIRQCYKACSALFGVSSSSSSPCRGLIELTKIMWPKYRQMYKMYNSNTTALRNSPEDRTYF